MDIVDITWALAILGGAAWLLYRFLWKGRGYYAGCDHAACGRSCDKK